MNDRPARTNDGEVGPNARHESPQSPRQPLRPDVPLLPMHSPLALAVLLAALVLAQACTSGTPDGLPPHAETTGKPEAPAPYTGELPLGKLNVPAGYGVDVFAEGLDNARSLAYAGDGLVFVGTRNEGRVYAAHDTDGDGRADRTYVLDTGLTMPNGVALKDGHLYVATVNEVLRYRDIRDRLEAPGEPEVVFADYPTDEHHGWKYIAFGPDGKLYIPVGAPCNICKSDEIYATITRLDVDDASAKPEIVAEGVRNSVGFAWHPTSGEMYFTDNGRDMLGDDVPPCELNRVTAAGQHFGYPYCHGGTIADPEFGDQRACGEFRRPTQNLGAHVAPLGIEFATPERFGELAGQALIAEHGSWNRTVPDGYRLVRVPLDDAGEGAGYEVFLDGWLDDAGTKGATAWGRPVDLEWLPDGSLLVSDDMAGAIYRVYRA